MRPAHAVFLVALAIGVLAQDQSLEAVTTAFNNANIPGDLAITFQPTALLEVTFPQDTGKPVTLHAGIQLPRNATKGPPTIKVAKSFKEPGPYVVAVVDPDAPTPANPIFSQIRHFLGGNFFLEGKGELRNTTDAITEFMQPTPPPGSSAHRYIFLLFKQPEGFNEQDIVTPSTGVRLFNVSDFANKVGLGDPLGGTFMLVAPDPVSV